MSTDSKAIMSDVFNERNEMNELCLKRSTTDTVSFSGESAKKATVKFQSASRYTLSKIVRNLKGPCGNAFDLVKTHQICQTSCGAMVIMKAHVPHLLNSKV